MRKLVALLAVGTLTACGGKPVSYFALTPQLAPDAYSCALRKVNELGYTVKDANRDAGFITADKQTTGALRKALMGNEDHDQLTVSVFDDAESQKRKMRVTAAATTARTTMFNTHTSGKQPSEAAIADANAVLSACSEGPITKQARGTPLSVTVEAFGDR